MRRLTVVLFLLIPLSLLGQDAKQSFHFEIKPANVSGTDEYTISKTADGYAVSGAASLSSAQGPIEITHAQELGPDWDFRQYNFCAKMKGEAQSVNATRKGATR